MNRFRDKYQSIIIIQTHQFKSIPGQVSVYYHTINTSRRFKSCRTRTVPDSDEENIPATRIPQNSFETAHFTACFLFYESSCHALAEMVGDCANHTVITTKKKKVSFLRRTDIRHFGPYFFFIILVDRQLSYRQKRRRKMKTKVVSHY